MPENVMGSFQGTAQVFQASLATLPLLGFAALITVYIVLGMLYESLIHPVDHPVVALRRRSAHWWRS